MSRQSVAKEAQGFTKTPKTCSTCKSFTYDTVRGGWKGLNIYERNLRCSIGNFKVNKMNTCNMHAPIGGVAPSELGPDTL